MVMLITLTATKTVLSNCKCSAPIHLLNIVSRVVKPFDLPVSHQQRNAMRPYGLRRSIRCPKKYGDGIKERPDMLAAPGEVALVPPQSEQELQKALVERYTRNAAVLPELDPAFDHGGAAAQDRVLIGGPTGAQGPLIMHGFTVPEYQRAYHSVVDPLLYTPCGETVAYSLELGRTIKESLFQELSYPTLHVAERPDGKVEVAERFCVLRSTPYIEVDMKGEPP